MLKFDTIIASFFTKIDELFSSIQGCVVVAICMIINFFINYQIAFVGVLSCIFIDMFVGIWCAIKLEKYARSELMRDTFSKIFIYCGSIIMVIFIEKLLNMDTVILTNICAALICATELWSIIGNALIINPRLYFFKFLKPALIGEIARKLQIPEFAVEEAFAEEDKLAAKEREEKKRRKEEEKIKKEK